MLTFNGHFDYYNDWDNSLCVKSKDFDPSDLIYEFMGKHIEKFKSRYNKIENKDRLGKERNRSINIDLLKFKLILRKS